MYKKISTTIFILLLSSLTNCSRLITGDGAAQQGQTFSFGIRQNLFSPLGALYVGALANINNDASKNFSFSRLVRDSATFEPLASERAVVNGQVDQPNPFFGKGILAIGLIEISEGLFDRKELPVVVTNDNPTSVVLVEDSTSPDKLTLVEQDDIKDANGDSSNGVIALATNGVSHVFAAVQPAGGVFGDDNSGIAVLVRGIVTQEQDGQQKNVKVFGQINVDNGGALDPIARRLDKTSPEVGINSGAATMENVAALHWDSSLGLLFIGLRVTAGNGAQDGVRAVVIGQLNGNIFTVRSIAPDTAFNDNTGIIGAVGSGQQVSVHNLKSIFTSTGVHYLIVAGNNGAPDDTTNVVFALPLVSTGSLIGTIANKDALPVDGFSASNTIISRDLVNAAVQANEMPKNGDVATQVGGGEIIVGEIVDMIVRNDTVYVVVESDEPEKSGIFYSQALFEASGKIKAWSAWQRAINSIDNTFGSVLNPFDGSFLIASGVDEDNVNTVKRTVWSDGDENGFATISALVRNELSQINGGVQSLRTFSPATPGLTDISLMIFGGLGKLVLVQSGTLDDVIIPTPSADFDDVVQFDNGTITQDVDSKIVIISGGVLDEIGPITACEIVQIAADNAAFFVGGTAGCAILAQANGTGWDPTQDQLGDGFDGLAAGMRFIKVGDYRFVNKLIHDQNFLYVVTDEKIDRINLTTSNFGTGNIQSVSVATQQGLLSGIETSAILDALISRSFGMILTTKGLMRVGDGGSIAAAANEGEIGWTLVAVAENAGAPIAIRAASQTGRDVDVAQNLGGHVYVLTADSGFDIARVNRFAVEPVGDNRVQNSTLQPFNDLFVKDNPSFFLNFGEFRNNFATDGALYFTTRGQNGQIAKHVSLLPGIQEPRVGVSNVGERSSTVTIAFGIGSEINSFERDATGDFAVAGDFGVQIHE